MDWVAFPGHAYPATVDVEEFVQQPIIKAMRRDSVHELLYYEAEIVHVDHDLDGYRPARIGP